MTNTPISTRRQFLEHTLLGSLGLTIIPHLTFAENVGKKHAERVIYIFNQGGMSHIDSFDPKIDPEIKGDFTAINTNVAGIQYCEYLPGMARHADKTCVVRGMHTNIGDHSQAQYYGRTSYKKIGSIIHPALGAWLCNLTDDNKIRPFPQNYLINGPVDHPKQGWMDTKYSPLPIFDPIRGLDNVKLKNKEEFDKRTHILAELNRETNKIQNPAIRSYNDFYNQTIKLLESKDLDVFDLSKEKKEVLEKYGNNRFGAGLCLARRLLEKGAAKYVEVDFSGSWDHHNNIADAMKTNLAVFDQGLTTLIEDLKSNGLLESTLIVVATDFGRTYRINSNRGRDHQPTAYTQLLIGAGIKQGSVYGITDAQGKEVADQQVTVPDFNATVAAALGLDTSKILVSPQQRPFTIADHGKVIQSILA